MVAKKPWGMLFPEVFAFVSKDIVTRCHNIYFFCNRTHAQSIAVKLENCF